MTLAAFLRHLGFAALLILLSAATVRLMIAARVMDTPAARKMHEQPTPKGGGVGIVVTFLIGIAVLYQFAAFTRLADPYFRGVIEASVAIAVVAFLDDLFDWPFTVKLGAQVLAGLVAVGSGLYAAAGLLATGLAGFLPFNFPRARIFMGDVGSQFCGFMLAVLAVVASRFDGVELSFLLVPMLLSGVLFDVAFTLVRRTLAGEAVTRPHRGHLYQVAQRSGLSPVGVTLIHWSFAIFGGACCLLFIAMPSAYKPEVPFLTLLPQLPWLWFVVLRARMAGIYRWG
jgi:UDP-N-acetylmuramyl pentapeptide phosphotransferase/UDP-N-acetylglucosamine-1-phosphate transferase